MISIELADFPSDELDKFHEVCCEQNVNPAHIICEGFRARLLRWSPAGI
jgi:hypothetical protein